MTDHEGPSEIDHEHGGAAEDQVSLLSWLHDTAEKNSPDADAPVTVPIAWMGRTSTDDAQDPTLSLPRQLDSARQALPDGFVIVAHFYDIESGRTMPEFRGRGDAHEKFQIPIPRDGGIADLISEAGRPDRRFVAVVCESIERVARTTYFSTKIEYELEQVGVPLLAADEGIDRGSVPSLTDGTRPAKRATSTLNRRVKQAISEWYVLNMLELSWGGYKEHTRQGYNIGKPPYGYQAKRMRHPVKAKAAVGKFKHRLVPDPARSSTVTMIFTLRALGRLSYQQIADHLNIELDRYPPPDPIPGEGRRRIGAWTLNSVREVLDNPKYTGYMVWNRRKRSRIKRGVRGKANPPSQWIWSPRPTHEPLITRALFEAASTIGRYRRGSRSTPGLNSHPKTARTYLLRSYLFCDLCHRRTYGSTRQKYTYYRCTPNAMNHGHLPWFPTHPRHILINEDRLLKPIAKFFAERVLGPSRKVFLAGALTAEPDPELALRREAIKAELAELTRRRTNLMRELQTYEPMGDPDVDTAWRNGLREQFAANVTQERAKTQQLANITKKLEDTAPPDVDLLDEIPQAAIDTTQLPEDHQRELYDAFHLEVRYNALTREVILRVTVDAETAEALVATVNSVLDLPKPRASPEPQGPGVEGCSPTPGPAVCDASRALGDMSICYASAMTDRLMQSVGDVGWVSTNASSREPSDRSSAMWRARWVAVRYGDGCDRYQRGWDCPGFG